MSLLSNVGSSVDFSLSVADLIRLVDEDFEVNKAPFFAYKGSLTTPGKEIF